MISITNQEEYEIIPFKIEHSKSIIEIRKTELKKEIDKDFPEDIANKLINELTIEKMEEISKEPNRLILSAVNKSGKVIGYGCLVDQQIRLVFIHEGYQKLGLDLK